MVPDVIHRHALWEALYGLGIFALAILVAWAVVTFLIPIIGRLASRTKTQLDDYLLRVIKAPLAAFIISQGAFTGLTASSFLDRHQDNVNKAWGAASLAIGFWFLQRLFSGLLTWYGHEIAARTQTKWDEQVLPILRRIGNFALLAIGALVVLDQVGVSISPLLAGLGIGGLAVALALQPTLANFVSGTYVLSDGSIRPGDFIEVKDGPSGTVHEVGWRTTKILSPANNLVIIPNSKLADSIVTNYQQPQPSTTIWLSCGVSYESDLPKVERVASEVLHTLRDTLPQTDKAFDPLVLFREFGDSNVNLFLVIRAADRSAGFTVTHEVIKAVHQRFRDEGIEISYPVRKIVGSLDGAALRQGAAPPGARADATTFRSV
jgi:small-conductance mechanosensitive channel